MDAIQEHDIVAREPAVAALIRITEYVVTKARTMQCHTSQISPYKIAVEQVASKLETYDGFVVAHPTGSFTDMFDLLDSLIEKP